MNGAFAHGDFGVRRRLKLRSDYEADFEIGGENKVKDLIIALQKIVDENQGKEMIMNVYAYEEGSGDVYADFYYEHVETDEEMRRRIEDETIQEQLKQRQADEEDKREYERLKKKFEGGN